MKKLLWMGLILASSLTATAQTDTLAKSIQQKAEAIGHGGNNELKINLLFTVLGIPEITYERLLVDNMGVGLSLAVGIDDKENDLYQFAITPHYRLYFGAKKASGFFIEGNASVVSRKDYYFYEYNMYVPGYIPPPNKSYTNFGLGAAAGGKFLTRNGFLGEAYLGVGRLFGNKRYDDDAYPRIGFTIGKRF